MKNKNADPRVVGMNDKHLKRRYSVSLRKSFKSFFLVLLALINLIQLLTVNSAALSSRNDLFKTNFTLTGNQAMDICKVAAAQIGNSNLSSSSSSYGEGWCDDFVCNCAESAGISLKIIPADQGNPRMLYDALMKCGASKVTTPSYGDIIFYSDFSHVALYVGGSGVSKYNTIHGNVCDSQKKDYSYIVRELNVDVSGKVIVRPKYTTDKKAADSINAWNRDKNTSKNGSYVINDISSINLYYAPADGKISKKASGFSRGEKLNVIGYYNGYVRIKQTKNESYTGTGPSRNEVYSSFVKFEDLAMNAFNYYRSTVTKNFKVIKNVSVYSKPCAEASVVGYLKPGEYIQSTAIGDNHVAGHKWVKIAENRYVYLSGGAISELTGSVSISVSKKLLTITVSGKAPGCSYIVIKAQKGSTTKTYTVKPDKNGNYSWKSGWSTGTWSFFATAYIELSNGTACVGSKSLGSSSTVSVKLT